MKEDEVTLEIECHPAGRRVNMGQIHPGTQGEELVLSYVWTQGLETSTPGIVAASLR
jgi:hypothetical protein